MEKINKNNNEKNSKKKRRKNKLKRQVSIFTVMLWAFLISTMITITVNSTKKTNALEVEDENWNIQLVMYDRSSDTPNQAITEFTWNAEDKSETKQLCMQINYACTTNKGYQPGEIEITIPGISKDSFSESWRNIIPSLGTSYENWLKNKVVIAGDKVTDITKKYDWSYSYNEEKNIYTFINNKMIEENEHFEGTIQIVYNLEPRFKINIGLEYKAKIRENILNIEEIVSKESNICKFNYLTSKETYRVSNVVETKAKADYTKIEEILNDYYWIRYEFGCYKNEGGIIKAYAGKTYISENATTSMCIKEEFPDGCILYDKDLNIVEPKEDNTYYYLNSTKFNSSTKYYYYVGYPKSQYNEGDIVTNVVELWGRYEDEEEMQKLAEASSSASLVGFDFEYKGELYGIYKNYVGNNDVYINKLKNGGENKTSRISATAFYTDDVMDIEIGDDLLYITRKNGEITKLNDEEFNFTQVKIPIFYTYNKYTENRGEPLTGYIYEILVRYKNSNEYTLYKEGITNVNAISKYVQEEVTFDRDDIVGVKIIIKGLDKTLYGKNTSEINVGVNMYTENHLAGGKIYNFAYLKVYKTDSDGNRVLVNEQTIDSYKTPSTINISEYDINTYGAYLQRAYQDFSIIDGFLRLEEEKFNEKINNNVQEERYEQEYRLNSRLFLNNYDVNKDVIIKQYDIFPLGMYLLSSEKEIINSINSNLSYQNLILKDGTIFNTNEELISYIKENTIVDIDYNYRESRRTKISIIYNLNDIDWSYYINKDRVSFNIFISLKVEIPYDSILEYGTRYINRLYGMWNNQEYLYESPSSIDNGKYTDVLSSDIDNDGDTEERLSYDSITLDITHAVSSQQAVIKQVRTDLTKGKFVEETAEATAGSEYTYKLRVTTGANSLKTLYFMIH